MATNDYAVTSEKISANECPDQLQGAYSDAGKLGEDTTIEEIADLLSQYLASADDFEFNPVEKGQLNG